MTIPSLPSTESDLVQLLSSSLSPHAQERTQAEHVLSTYCTSSDALVQLCRVALDPAQATSTPAPVRQMALVWIRSRLDWEGRGEEEKGLVKGMLLEGLRENNPTMQTAVGLVIAEICRSCNVAQDWSELMPSLVSVVTSGTSASTPPLSSSSSSSSSSVVLERGALRVLCLLVEDLDSLTVVHLSLAVLPRLVGTVQRGGFDRAESVYQVMKIVHAAVDAVEMMYRTSEEAKVLLREHMGSWLEACRVVLGSIRVGTVGGGDGGDGGDGGNDGGGGCEKLAAALSDGERSCLPAVHLALGVVARLVPLIGKGNDVNVGGVLESVWACNGVVRELYLQARVLGAVDEPDVPGGAITERTTLSDVACQLMEVFGAIVTSPKLKKACAGSLVEIVAGTIQPYMMIGEEDVAAWGEDCTMYLQGGEDCWGCRCSGGLLIESILETYGSAGAEALAAGVERCVEGAEGAAAARDVVYWRMMEATLLALGDAADSGRVRKLGRAAGAATGAGAGGGCAGAKYLDPNVVLPWLLINPRYNGAATPLLMARIFSYAGRYASVRMLSEQTRALVLERMGEAIAAEGIPQAIYGGIFQGLAAIVKGSDAVPSDVSNHFMGCLVMLLASAEEDTLHLLLENIQELVRKDPTCVRAWAGKIVPVAVKAWVDNYNDPILGDDAFALLRSLARSPGGMEHMMASAIPTIKAILDASSAAPAFLVSSCFDLLTEIASPAATADVAGSEREAMSEATKGIFVEFMPICLALLQSQSQIGAAADEDVMASVSAFMRTSLQLGVWYSPVETHVSTFVQVVQYLLRPETPDRGAQHVGGIVLALMPHLSHDAVPEVLRLVATRLTTAEDPALVQSLLGVVASFARVDASAMAEALGGPLFQAVMDKWCERHIEIRTPYDIKRSVVALAAVLACPNPIIDQIFVRGHRIDTGPAIRTRSKAVTMKEEWNSIPLRQKILLLLVDAFIEARVTRGDEGSIGEEDEGEWESDDWEEDEGDEGDEGEDAGARPQSAYSVYGEFIGDDDEFEIEEFVDYLELRRRETDELNNLELEAWLLGVIRSRAASLQEAQALLTETQKQYLAAAF